MEGVFFLLIAWSAFLYYLFISEASYRKKMTFVVLMIISVFPYCFTVNNIEINAALIVVFLFVSYSFITDRFIYQLYYLLLSWTITCATVACFVVELFDPASIFFNRTWLFSILLVMLVITLPMRAEKKVPVFVMGILQAEWLYKDIVAKLMLERTIGDAAFFDFLSIALLLIVSWQAFERMTTRLQQTVEKVTKSSVGGW